VAIGNEEEMKERRKEDGEDGKSRKMMRFERKCK